MNQKESLNVYPVPELVYLPVHEWQEADVIIVIKEDAAWQRVQPSTQDWDVGVALDAPLPSEDAYKKLLKRADGMGEIVYAVGGVQAVDAAKYVAESMDLALICVPTALSSDAFWMWSSSVRDKGVTVPLETIPPEIMLLDMALLAGAAEHERASGIADVFSISTACHDWLLAEQRGKNSPEEKYTVALAAIAKTLLQNALDCAEAAGAGDPEGLRALVNALTMTVQLNNLSFHSRATEGSEHHFAWCAEALDSNSVRPHAQYLAPAILQMAEKQGQDAIALRKALQAARVPLTALPQTLIDQTLKDLPAFVVKHDLPYGIAYEL